MPRSHTPKPAIARVLRWALPTPLLAVAVSGCADYPQHDLGFTTGDARASDGSESAGPPVARLASEFAGVWIGSVGDPFALQGSAEDVPPAFRFPSGSTQVRLEFVMVEGEALPSGTLTFGEGTPPAATDGSVGYPVDPAPKAEHLLPDASIRPPVDGFAYTVYPTAVSREVAGDPSFLAEGVLVDGKLDLSFWAAEAFGPWCALQTAETCPSGGTATSDDGQCYFPEGGEPVDCLKVAQCSSEICECVDDLPCWGSLRNSSALSLRLSEGGLVGLFNGAVFRNQRGFQQPVGTAHFRPAAPGE